MKKILLTTITLLCIIASAFGQDRNLTLSGFNSDFINPATSRYFEFKARDGVKLTGNCTMNSSQLIMGNVIQRGFKIYTDPSITPPASYNTLSSTGTPANQTPFSTSNVVGSSAGSADVSPTGAAIYNIPISIPQGTNGMQPNLSIVYNSQEGNNLLGKGWELIGLSSITFSPKTNYYNFAEANKLGLRGNDIGFTLDGKRLISINGNYGEDNTIYSFDLDPFSKIQQIGNSFILTTKDGKTIEYGNTSDSKINNGASTFIWKINKITDNNGNYLKYYYNSFDNGLISKIEYTFNNQLNNPPFATIQFIYDDRTDVKTSYTSFGTLNQTKILTKIEIVSNSNLFKTYQFDYTKDEFSTLLSEITEIGYDGSKFNTTKINWGNNCTNNSSVNNSISSQIPFYDRILNSNLLKDGKNETLVIRNGKVWPLNEVISGKIELYSELGQLITSLSYPSNTLIEQVTPVDLNNDGKDELIVFEKTYFNFDYGINFNNQIIYKFNYNLNIKIYSLVSNILVDVTIDYPNFGLTYNNLYYTSNVTLDNYFYSYEIGDYNGDLILDAMLIKTIYNIKIADGIPKKQMISINKVPFIGNGGEDFINDLYYGFYFASSNNSLGSEILLVTKNNLTVVEARTNFFTYRTYALSGQFNPPTGYTFDQLQLQVSDFNGDGISDLLCIKTTTPTSQSNINYFDRFMYDQMGVIYSHVYKSGAEKITNVWVALGNGQSFNSWKSLTLPSYANYIQTPNLTFNIGDFIGDSKVEILFTEQISSNKNLINSHFYEITEEGFIQKLQLSHYLNDNSCSNLINFTSDKIDVADFNSDGKLELFVKNYSTCSNKIINFTKDNCFSDLVSSIENGYGNINQFTYNYLNNSNNYSIVNTTITSAVSVNEPIKIVTNYKFLTPTKTVTNNNYYYKNLLYKNTGGIRGILGFEEMTISELISNRKKITNFTFPDDQLNSLFPAKITTYNLNNIKISESTNSNTFFTNGYFKILSSTSNLDKDYLKSTSIKKVSNFETTFGNLISSENWIYDDINLSQLTYYRKQDFLDYVQSGSWCQNKFQTLKSTYLNPNSGKPATVFTDKITYNNGNLNSYKKFSGTDNEITTTYSNFNAFGTPKTIAISALNVDTKINTNEYDYTGRFVLRTTNSLGQQNSFSYDNFGNLISETNLNSITTNYTYNGFNQLTKIITNEGEIEQDIEWTDGSYPNSLYRKAIYRDDRQAEFTYYDYLGQEISFQTTELKNIYQDKIYNDDGTINSISNLYYESELPQLNKIEYDEFNRVLKTESKGNIINFSYVGNKVTLTDSKSRNKSTTTNAVGKVTQTKDIQGNVISNYTYDNLLQPLTIGTNTISYNSYGLKESITDPNSGTISYGYDAYGRLTSQIDAAGIKYEYTYDVLDRILSSKTTNDEIIYSYVTKGYGIGNIESTISLSNGNAKYFYYNRLGKIEILKEISAGQTFITKYEYDETGNNISVIYPSGLKITNNYSSGTLISVSKDNKVIWRINEKNSTSLKYNFGDNKTTTVSYTFDEISRQLKEIKAQTLSGVKSFHYTYNFDVNTGNLINRKDNLNLSNNKPLFEEFDYNLDRLSQIKQNGTITNTINYATNGNILQKSDVGTYTYDQSKVNLVTRITPPPTEFALTQNITYNKFGKATKITEGVNTFNIMYGPNQERVKMEYLNSSDNSKNFTRYYACNFEKEIKGSTTKEINYIASSNGTIAAYITVNGSNGQFYYFIHDHLGSIVQIIDNNGVVVEERSFDAWGRKRNVKDWTYTVTNTPSLISRGYTGHEHLYEVGIINTNARLYEPLTGRMLSPDIYIQTPDNLQSYNRYSYVMNNPLKYNDPSGNIWGLVIGAIVGMELGGTIANNGEPNPFKWKNNSATWIGVIGGGIAGALIGDGIEALAGGNPVIFRGTGATQVKPGEQGAGGFNNMPIGTKNTLGQQIENTTISPNSINSTLGYTNEIPGNGTQLELWKSYWRSGLDNLTYATDNQFVNVVMQYLVRSMSQPTTMATMNNLNNGNINNYTDRNIGGSFMPVGGGSIFDFTINVTGNNFTNVDINHSSVAGNTYSLGFSANGNTLQTTVLSFNFNSTQEARRFSTHFDNIMINQRNLLMNNGLPFSYYKTYFP